MGYCRARKTHEKYYSKLVYESLKSFGGFVFLVGKPFFLLLLVFLRFSNNLFLYLLGFYRKRKYIKRIIKKYGISKSLALTVITIILLLPIYFFLQDLPSPKTLSSSHPPLSSKIYDRNGKLLYKIYEDENRTLAKLSEIPKHTVLATLAIEDNEFYKHPGFSVKGIVRAVSKNIREKDKLYGGSTITQQLVKNTLLTPEKSIKRKIKELVLAVECELYYSKSEILEMYLNISPYGGTIYGIKEAAMVYFGKDVKDLTLAESAFLAGIPKNPTSYSPFIGDPEKSFSRQKEVLDLMLSNGYINNTEYNHALSDKLEFANNKTNILAPHFVMYVKGELEKKYGKDLISQGGLAITTSLDLDIQKIAEDIVSQELSKLKNYKVTNAGVVVVNPKNGEILAMVGSENYFDLPNKGNVNSVFALRPPGSTIKAVNYAYALSHGYTLATIIDDSPVVYSFRGSAPYSPVNYDKTFKGKISLRSAFAQSRNVPAVKVLNSYGVEKMLKMGVNLGITTWTNPKYYGLSMTLGGANTTLFDLAQVYSVFANGGVKKNFNAILNIKNFENIAFLNANCQNDIAVLPTISNTNQKFKDKFRKLLPNTLITLSYASFSASQNDESGDGCESVQVLDPRVSYLITSVLADNFARSPTFGLNSQLNIKNHKEVAVKTGTSNSMRDNIAIGYNQDYLVAVWVGNNDNSPMSHIASGITGATPIFNKIMTELLKNSESADWKVPGGLVKKTICQYIKKADSDEVVTKRYDEWFLEENVPKNTCQEIKKTDPKTQKG